LFESIHLKSHVFRPQRHPFTIQEHPMRTLFRTVLPAVALTALAGSVVAQPARVVVEPPVVEVKPVSVAPTIVVPVDASVRYWSYYPSAAVIAPPHYQLVPVSTCARALPVRYVCGCERWWSGYPWIAFDVPTYYWPTIAYWGTYWHNYYGWLTYWPAAYNPWWVVSEAKPAAKPEPPAITAERTAASLYSEALVFYWKGDGETAARLLSAAVQREPREAKLWYFKALAERAMGQASEAAESARRGAALEMLNPTAAPQLGLALERVQGDDRKFLRVAMDGLTPEKAEQISASAKATSDVATK
jgi:hypothetical protein